MGHFSRGPAGRQGGRLRHAPLTARLVALLVALPLVALGHAHLLATSPAASASLIAAPRSVTLSFNESVRLAVLKLESATDEVPLPVDRNAAPAKTVTVALPALKPGAYEVRWSAITVDDGHIVTGRFGFEWHLAPTTPP